MEAAQENGVKRHQTQQLSFNSLQVVLAVGMVAVGAMVRRTALIVNAKIGVMNNIIQIFTYICSFIVFHIPIYIFKYKNDCNMGAAMFLMAGGGIMLFINLFSLFAWATPFECDDM